MEIEIPDERLQVAILQRWIDCRRRREELQLPCKACGRYCRPCDEIAEQLKKPRTQFLPVQKQRAAGDDDAEGTERGVNRRRHCGEERSRPIPSRAEQSDNEKREG